MDTYSRIRRLLSTVLPVASLIAILAPSVAKATPTQVNVRIEGKRETLFEGPIRTEGHGVEGSSDTQERPCNGTNNGQHTTPGPTPTAASVDAMGILGETFDGQWYTGYDDYFVTRWGQDAQSPAEGAYWGILVNDVFTDVGGCQYELGADDEVLWVYNAFESRPNLALFPAGDEVARPPLTVTAELDKPFAVEVIAYADNEEDNPPAEPERSDAMPYAGADVSPVLTSTKGSEKVETERPETVNTNAEGKASIIFTTPGWHRIKATIVKEDKEDALRSNRIDVCVPALGETGCGEPPAEDQTRTPPSVEDEIAYALAKHHEEELSETLPVVPVKTISGAPAGAAPYSAGSPTGSASSISLRVQPSTHQMTSTRAQRLAGALKRCKREKLRKKRVRCEKRVRKKYAPKAKKKKRA